MSLDAGFRGLHGAQLALLVREALDLDLYMYITLLLCVMYLCINRLMIHDYGIQIRMYVYNIHLHNRLCRHFACDSVKYQKHVQLPNCWPKCIIILYK